MARWLKLATLLVALGLLVLAYVLPWFHGASHGDTLRVFLNPFALRGESGLVAEMCGGVCIEFPTGRLPGGLAWLDGFGVLGSIAMLAISAYLVVRDRPIAQLGLWSVITAIGVLVLSALVALLFEGPEGWDTGISLGLPAVLLGSILTIVGQSSVFELLEPGYVEPERPHAASHPVAATASPAPARREVVLAGEFAFAGLRLTLDSGPIRVGWEELVVATLPSYPELALELTTRDGHVLRITTASRIDYRFLPEGPGATDADNLRRLHAFARERNRSL